MTFYYYLPVYKTSYDLLLAIFKLTKDFEREYKYTIGQDLKNVTTESRVNRNSNTKANGFSVRCVQDWHGLIWVFR